MKKMINIYKAKAKSLALSKTVKQAYGSIKGKLSYKDSDLVGTDADVQEMFYGKN